MTELKKREYKFLDRVERIGNKIPHPFILFSILTLLIVLLSVIFNFFEIGVTNYVDGKEVKIRSLVSEEGINFMLQSMVKNFTGFSPLGLVLVMTLGIGLMEKVGLISVFIRSVITDKYSKHLVFLVMIIGICGNIASDIATVIIPSIAAMIFLSLGRHPLVGVAVGYAATTAGFSANLIIAGTDALLAGISTEAIKIINPNIQVSILSNWYFMSASTIVLAIVGTIVTNKIIEPRLGKYRGKKLVITEEVNEIEKRALRKSGIYGIGYILLIMILVHPKKSFLRAASGSLLNSPLLKSITPLLLILFLIVGITYGKSVGKIKKSGDVPKLMGKAIEDMSSYIVLVFMIGQFIAYFNWTKIAYVIAISGARVVERMNLEGLPLFIVFILFVAFINLFMGSGSAKWALLAPIFVPMFYILGYEPSLTQMLYRVGDSTTNIISPLAPYLGIIIGIAEEYDENCKMGTIISMMMPYTLAMLSTWIIFVVIWISLGIPLGLN